jgi:hypothetical protein
MDCNVAWKDRIKKTTFQEEVECIEAIMPASTSSLV